MVGCIVKSYHSRGIESQNSLVSPTLLHAVVIWKLGEKMGSIVTSTMSCSTGGKSMWWQKDGCVSPLVNPVVHCLLAWDISALCDSRLPAASPRLCWEAGS